MAKNKGFSLDPDDSVVGGGLFGNGRAKILKARFGPFEYRTKAGQRVGKPVTVLLVTYKREGEKHLEPYTVGDGFKASKDGLTLIPKSGQTGLVKSSKCMMFLDSFKAQGMAKPEFSKLSRDISILDGAVLELIRKSLPKFVSRNAKKGEEPKERSVLIVDEIIKASFKFTKPDDKDEDDGDDDADEKDEKDEDEEDDDESKDSDDDDDDDDDEPQKKKGKKKDDDDEDDDDSDDDDKDKDDDDSSDDDDDDEKAEADDDDDDDDDSDSDADEGDDDEDSEEAAGELILDALEDGPIKKAKVFDTILAKAKKSKKHKAKAKAIATWAKNPANLKKETNWSWDGKQITAN